MLSANAQAPAEETRRRRHREDESAKHPRRIQLANDSSLSLSLSLSLSRSPSQSPCAPLCALLYARPFVGLVCQNQFETQKLETRSDLQGRIFKWISPIRPLVSVVNREISCNQLWLTRAGEPLPLVYGFSKKGPLYVAWCGVVWRERGRARRHSIDLHPNKGESSFLSTTRSVDPTLVSTHLCLTRASLPLSLSRSLETSRVITITARARMMMPRSRLVLALVAVLCCLRAGAEAQTADPADAFPVIWEEWQSSVEAALTGRNFSFSRWEIYAPSHDRLRLHYGPTWDKQVSIEHLDEGRSIRKVGRYVISPSLFLSRNIPYLTNLIFVGE
jgi:hypothetical protein